MGFVDSSESRAKRPLFSLSRILSEDSVYRRFSLLVDVPANKVRPWRARPEFPESSRPVHVRKDYPGQLKSTWVPSARSFPRRRP